MKKVITICIAIVCSIFLQITAYAHPGRTDANGGHYDHKTGEYHYHNGEYAGRSHNNSSSSTKKDDDFTRPDDYRSSDNKSVRNETSQEKSNYNTDFYAEDDTIENKKLNKVIIIVVVSLCLAASFVKIFLIIRSKYKSRKEYEEERCNQIKKWKGKSVQEIIGYPFDIYVENDKLVYIEATKDSIYGYYTFYISHTGKYIHKKKGCDNADIPLSSINQIGENSLMPRMSVCPVCRDLYFITSEDIKSAEWYDNFLSFVSNRQKYDIPYSFFKKDVINEEEIIERLKEIKIKSEKHRNYLLNKIQQMEIMKANNTKLLLMRLENFSAREQQLRNDIEILQSRRIVRFNWSYIIFYLTDKGKVLTNFTEKEKSINRKILLELISSRNVTDLLPSPPVGIFVDNNMDIHIIDKSSYRPYGSFTLFKTKHGKKLHYSYACSRALYYPVSLFDYADAIEQNKSILCSRCFSQIDYTQITDWYKKYSILRDLILYYELQKTKSQK